MGHKPQTTIIYDNTIETTQPPDKGFSLSLPLSYIANWFKDRKAKKDINNIKEYEDIILTSNEKQDQ